jgi:uncharacterized protein
MLDLIRALRRSAAAFILVFAGPALAAEPAVVVAPIQAHPALWTVRSDAATAYLFGSIHILPPNINWHSPAVDKALAASDVFVFEAPLGEEGQADTQAFVRAHGVLPPELALPSLLNEQARKDYRAAIVAANIPPAQLVHLRPWLASLVLETHVMQASHYSPDSGVDRQVFAYARARQKSIENFETVSEQLSLLMPKDMRLEVQEFDATLKETHTEMHEVGGLVDAWSQGRMNDVAQLMNRGLAGVPGAMKILIDDRNAKWVTRLATMLGEHHTYFVTVGAGHLGGPRGVPALLAARGYHVSSESLSP